MKNKDKEIDESFINMSQINKNKGQMQRNSNLYLADSRLNKDELRTNYHNRARVRKRKLKKFFAIVFSMIITMLLLCSGVIFFYFKTFMTPEEQKNISTLVEKSMNQVMDMQMPSFGRNRITALLLGVDKEGSRTDVIMIATVNKKNNQVDLISIPRDTRIIIPDDVYAKIKASGKYPGKRVKLTELNAWCSNLEDPTKILEEYLEDMLDIKIDYYAKIDTEAFSELVDEVGGIEFNVPQSMYKSDPTQNLLINLKPGLQTLNGKQAEGLVRFRGYTNGDFQRMKMQQEFLKTAFEQIMSKTTKEKLPSLAKKLYKYVETDFNITGIPEAVSILLKIDAANINTHTLPARTQTIDGISYVIHDQAGTIELIDSIWNPNKNQDDKEAIKWQEY